MYNLVGNDGAVIATRDVVFYQEFRDPLVKEDKALQLIKRYKDKIKMVNKVYDQQMAR